MADGISLSDWLDEIKLGKRKNDNIQKDVMNDYLASNSQK